MRKSPDQHGELLVSRLLYLLLPAILLGTAHSQTPQANAERHDSAAGYSALIQSQIHRLEAELERTRALVEDGTVARVRLAEVEGRLADARDEGVLAETLYGPTPVEKFTETQARAMIGAAQRRVDRETIIVESRRMLLTNGVISPAEFETMSAALDTRRQVLVLARNRMRLLEDLRQMAEVEKRAEMAANTTRPGTLKNSMVRYDGNGAFTLADVPAISSQFERRFHHSLPVSASGQTLLHQSLGLDHRNRVDVAIGPDSDEGVWLRSLLERLHVPYLAFTSAIPGAATAPHIHIGIGSTRLRSGAGS